MRRVVLDTGALIGLERGVDRVISLIRQATRRNVELLTVSGVVAQYWRGGAGKQTPVARLLKSDALRVDELTTARAQDLGRHVLSRVDADVTDAHVAWLAEQLRAVVVTSDPDHIRAISPAVRISRI